MSRFISLSSINRIFGIVFLVVFSFSWRCAQPPGWVALPGAADGGGQFDQIRWVLGNDPYRLSAQDAEILRGQLLCRHYDDRDAREDRPRAQFPQKFEAVHLRHHKVEQD